MLFSLIKNEQIKLMKKSKTWIVFALFAIFIAVTVFAQFHNSNNMIKFQSVEYQLENAEHNLDYYQDELKNVDKNTNPEYISYLEQQIESAKLDIETYKKLLENSDDEESWKFELENQIKWEKENLANYENYNDEWSIKYKLQAQERLDMLNYLKDNNIKPLYGWEYEAYNYMRSLFQFLGMSILVCGIAIFMSDIVSGECTPATLKFLLIQPVSRGKILLSKFISVTLTSLTMLLGGELLGFLFVKLTSNINASSYPVMIGSQYANEMGTLTKIAGSGYMGTNLELLVYSLLFQVLFIITTCAVIFMISTLIKSSMISMSVSVVVLVFVTILSQNILSLRSIAHLFFVNYGDATGILTGVSALDYGNTNLNIMSGIIVMIVTTVVAYLIAHINFNKKDILI